MPIIEVVAADSPLTQGDILDGIRLFSTGDCWKEERGEAVVRQAPFSLVISRPCAIEHKKNVTVCAVEPIKEGVPDNVKSFEEILQFLKDLRDGTESVDSFYLGELQSKGKRYLARLDAFYDVGLPIDNEERRKFLAEKRIGRLCGDFARDLHVRVFRSFASLGFDDYGWYSTKDLGWVVNAGKLAITEAEKALQDKITADGKLEWVGKSIPEKVISQHSESVEEIKLRLAPFVSEMEKRQGHAVG